ILPPLFWCHFGTTLFAYHTQKGACPHCQCQVAIPARKRTHLVVIQPHLALGALDTFFDRPACSGHPHQFAQSRVRSGKGDIAGHLTRIADGAAHEQKAFPALLRWSAQLLSPPIVETQSFTARASAEPLPALTRQLGQNGLNLLLLLSEPDA